MTGLIDPGPIEWDGVIQSNDSGGAWVDVPFDLKATYGRGNLVPIVATFNRKVTYQGSLAKMGGERGMLLLRSDVRAELGVEPGDSVHVKLELDLAPRVVELPADVAALVAANPDAAATWERLAPSHKRAYVTWIEEAKRPETRQRRVEQTIVRLAKGEKLR